MKLLEKMNQNDIKSTGLQQLNLNYCVFTVLKFLDNRAQKFLVS